MAMKAMLCCFELASRLKVNFSKNMLGGVGINQLHMRNYASMLNCDVMKTPFKYLGMEIGGNHRRIIFWEGIIDKIRKRLDRWKGKF